VKLLREISRIHALCYQGSTAKSDVRPGTLKGKPSKRKKSASYAAVPKDSAKGTPAHTQYSQIKKERKIKKKKTRKERKEKKEDPAVS